MKRCVQRFKRLGVALPLAECAQLNQRLTGSAQAFDLVSHSTLSSRVAPHSLPRQAISHPFVPSIQFSANPTVQLFGGSVGHCRMHLHIALLELLKQSLKPFRAQMDAHFAMHDSRPGGGPLGRQFPIQVWLGIE